MAKLSMIVANERRKKMVQVYKPRRDELRKRSKDINLSDEERYEARIKLARLPRNSSPVRVVNRCLLTGRPRGVLSKKFMLSRMEFRRMALNGELPGVTKASW